MLGSKLFDIPSYVNNTGEDIQKMPQTQNKIIVIIIKKKKLHSQNLELEIL